MAIDNELLKRLMGGGQVADPTAQFLAQTFLQGKAPGDQGAAMQNVLTNLAPGVMAEREAGGAGLGASLGMKEEEAMSALKMMLGLAMTAPEEAGAKVSKELAGAATTEAEASKTEAEAKIGQEERKENRLERQLQMEEKNAPIHAAALEAQAELHEAQAANFEQEAANLEQARAWREMARTGQDGEGNLLSDTDRRTIIALSGLKSTNPDIIEVSKFLLESDDPRQRQIGAAQLGQELGIDLTSIADPPAYFASTLARLEATFGGNETKAAPKGGSAEDALKKFEEALRSIDQPKE